MYEDEEITQRVFNLPSIQMCHTESNHFAIVLSEITFIPYTSYTAGVGLCNANPLEDFYELDENCS